MAFSLAGKTAFITGGSRGIGLEIGKKLASRGANVAIAAKTAEPHKLLPGTIHSAIKEIEEEARKNNHNDAKGLAIQMDIRQEDKVRDAIEQTVDRFGQLDILINNASAINMKASNDLEVKHFDLMNGINARGTWMVSKFAIPHLLASAEANRNPHILTLAPPLNNNQFSLVDGNEGKEGSFIDFGRTGAAYAVAKVGMSIAGFALAAELQGKVASNLLWPYTLIGTAAMNIVSPDAATESRRWRKPDIVAEAAVRFLEGADASKVTGRSLVDEIYLRKEHGFTTEMLREYNVSDDPSISLDDLAFDLYVPAYIRKIVNELRQGVDSSKQIKEHL